MLFTELNPLMSGRSQLKGFEDTHELSFNCPVCGMNVSVRVHFNGGEGDRERSVWKLTIPEGNGWESATITPSIWGHHKKRTPDGDVRCPVHISISEGTVSPA
jgi:hypothetical protein